MRIAGRLLAAIPTLFGVITLVFVVMRLVPGTIVDQILANGDSSEEVRRSTDFCGRPRCGSEGGACTAS